MVAATVAKVLGFELAAGRPAIDAIVDVVRAQSLFLLLDNCEHLLAPVAALVSAIARAAPGVRVLATSIEPLKIDDEQLFRLDTLAVPAGPGLDVAKQSGAVQLFVERVRAADPRFALTPANVHTVVAICQRLDGIPLALELAAARVPLLGVEGLHDRLDERLRLLGSGARASLRRHQTLRAALDFTHGLLTPEERTCFRRLGAFAGSFSLEAAQDVISDAAIDRWAVLDHLGALVDKSILLVESDEPHRLRLLETARVYALEKLAEAGETAETKHRHARVMAKLLAGDNDAIWLESDAARVARFAPEIDNIRAAAAWTLEYDAALAIELCSTMGFLFVLLELHPEGARYCEAALAGVSPDTPPLAHGRLWHSLTLLSLWWDPARTREAARRAVELLRETGDSRRLCSALLGMIPHANTLSAEQLAAYAEIERRFDPSAPPAVRAVRASAAGRVHRIQGRHAEARRWYAEGTAQLLGYAEAAARLAPEFSELAEDMARERALHRLEADAQPAAIAAWQADGATLDAAAAYRLALAAV